MATATRTRTRTQRRRKHLASPRRELDPDSTDLKVRSALHLRVLLEKKQWSAGDLHRALEAEGETIGFDAVKKWLRGDTFPTTPLLVTIAKVLGIADYRKILPPPL